MNEPIASNEKTNPLILVTGAAGKTGNATVRALLEQEGVRVRALVRREDDRARAMRKAGADVVVGNMDDIRDMRQAMRDVQRAYFVAPLSNCTLDQAMNFAIAAEEAKLEHVVAMSQWLTSASHPSEFTRRHWLLERMIEWMPTVGHTFINVGWFADNYMAILGLIANFGIFPLAIQGKTAPVDHEDIGRVVAAVLVNPAPYANRTLRPTGPELMTPQQIADTFGKVLGRKVRHVFSKERFLSKSLKARGEKAFAHAQVLNYVREYHRGTMEFGAPNDVVQEVTGRPAADFETIVRRYVASDPMAQQSLGNKLKVMQVLMRAVVTSPMDVERWRIEQDMPRIAHPEDCIDSTDWKSTHAARNAYGVNTG